jgi:hypothetical protein
VQNKLELLSNLLSQKEILTIEVNGSCNENGEIEQIFWNNIELKENISYNIALLSLSTSSFFPNIIKDSNNLFYYSEKDSSDVKTIVFETGAYELKDINEYIKFYLKDNVTISLIESTGKCRISLADGWKVYFNKPNTFKKILGFTKTEVVDSTTLSDEIIDVLTIQRIYLHCDICRGSIYNGKPSSILFSFNNFHRWGFPLAFNLNPLQEKQVVIKKFNRIKFTFIDNNNRPIDFLKSPVTLSIQIRQV